MIDPSLCTYEATWDIVKYWTRFTWWAFGVLTTPALVIPPLVGLTVLPWLLRRLKRKRWISGFGALLLSMYLLVLTPIAARAANKLLVYFLPADSGATVDAIVVLGRGPGLRPERVDVATELWKDKRSPLVFASGRGDAPDIVQMLEAKGIPATALDGEPCSRTTQENALLTAEILQPRGVQRILLVTDPPHMMRSMLTFRNVGFQVIPHANPLPQQMKPKARAFLVFRECVGLVGYGLLGRFSSPADRTAQLTEQVTS